MAPTSWCTRRRSATRSTSARWRRGTRRRARRRVWRAMPAYARSCSPTSRRATLATPPTWRGRRANASRIRWWGETGWRSRSGTLTELQRRVVGSGYLVAGVSYRPPEGLEGSHGAASSGDHGSVAAGGLGALEGISAGNGHRALEEAHDRARVELIEQALGVEARGDAAGLGAAADDPVVAVEARGAPVGVTEDDHRVARTGGLHGDAPGGAVGRGVGLL